MAGRIFKLDPLIVILGILGIILMFFRKEKRDYWMFIMAFQLSGFILLVLSNWLETHYTLLMPFLCIFGGFFVHNIAERIKLINYKKAVIIFCILILIFQLYLLMPHLTSKCALSQTRGYISENFDKNSIVVTDSRIYRGRVVWMLYDYHYLEASFFSQFLDINQNLSGKDIQTKLYFIECASDDCGWGTIKDQPELNQSMEEFVSLFSNMTSHTIYGGGGFEDEKREPTIRIYQGIINLKSSALDVVDSTHEWFYYPVNYQPKEKIFDQYAVKGFFNSLLYGLAWLILISSIISALIMAVIPFIELIKQK